MTSLVGPSVITRVLPFGGGGRRIRILREKNVSMEAEVGMMHFEDGGRDHESRGYWGPLEKAREQVLLKSLQRKAALPTP